MKCKVLSAVLTMPVQITFQNLFHFVIHKPIICFVARDSQIS